MKIINNSKKEITYGEDFSIYKKNSKGKWKIVKWNKGYGFGDVEHVLMAGYSTKKTFYVDKSAISKKMKKNTTYKIKFKISGKNKTIKFKIK